MEEERDLFEFYEELPQEVQDILLSCEDDSGFEFCEELLALLEPHGYIFDYGLCGEPFNLRKIE